MLDTIKQLLADAAKLKSDIDAAKKLVTDAKQNPARFAMAAGGAKMVITNLEAHLKEIAPREPAPEQTPAK